MKKREYIAIIVLIILFVLFACLQSSQRNYYDVISVIAPDEIVVDINSNGVVDDDETVKVLQGYQYITKHKSNLDDVLKLDDKTHYAFYYLTEKYINDVLLDKKILFKKGRVYINGEDYQQIIQRSGYLFKDNSPVNIKAYQKRLNQINKADYRLYNTKSNKYHMLDCEYGNKAHNYVLVAKSQLPKGAKGCNFCVHKKQHTHIKQKSTSHNDLELSCGNIKIFLTDHTTHLKPNRNGNTPVCRELIKQIDNSKTSIDIAIYGYDRVPKIEQAIKRAILRGVKVRLVHDTDTKSGNIYANTSYFAKLIRNTSTDIAPQYLKDKSGYTNSIMHNKFYIFDRERVVTGSANLSYTDMSDYNSNCVLLINSKQIAQIYTQEFEQMYNSKFHNLKSQLLNKYRINVGNSFVSVYYSPKDNVINALIVPKINEAKKYIYIPTFLITETNIANALLNAKKRGVDIKIIVDATNAKNNYSKHHLLRTNGVLVKTENYAGKLHSKSILIDDKYAIIGSMNFSRSGNFKNDENMLLIENPEITKFYKKFFIYLWNRIPDYWLTHDVSAESIYSVGSCNDGIDNDYDGKTDYDDEGCKAKLKKFPKR
ncbi:MAG: hypothetical protein K6E29_08705 [Cyanobacteria bacterium RUI128]|nr:hypothetical protein [Cyanobacteria bacterium RUI128]